MTDIPPPGRSRISFFVESAVGLKAYIEIDGADCADESLAKAMVEALDKVGADLAHRGFKHDTSFDKPAYGGGGGGNRFQKGDGFAAPPTDIPIPPHCGQPMKYKPKGPNGDDGKPKWNAKYVCSKDTLCADVVEGGSKYPGTVWEDSYRKTLAAQKARDEKAAAKQGAPPANAGAPPPPRDPKAASDGVMASFWIKTQQMNFNKAQVHAVAGVETTKGFSRDDLKSLLDRLTAINRGEAFTDRWQRPSTQG